MIGHDLVLADDCLANMADDLVGCDAVPVGPLDLLHDDELLRLITLADGKRSTAMASQRRMAALDRILDVLRIVVRPADDHDLLEASGNEQLARFVDKAEIAGAQPAFDPLAVDMGAECGRVGFGIAPIAASEIGPGDPDLADPVGTQPPASHGIDDRDPLAGESAAAPDHDLPIAGIGAMLMQCLA